MNQAQIKSLSLSPGDEIEFYYTAGTHPNTWRTMFFDNLSNTHLGAKETKDGQYKSFTLANIISLRKIAPSNAVTKELAAIQQFVSSHPAYAQTLIQVFNSKHGTNYILKDGKVAQRELSRVLSAVVRKNVNGHLEKIEIGTVTLDFNTGKIHNYDSTVEFPAAYQLNSLRPMLNQLLVV